MVKKEEEVEEEADEVEVEDALVVVQKRRCQRRED